MSTSGHKPPRGKNPGAIVGGLNRHVKRWLMPICQDFIARPMTVIDELIGFAVPDWLDQTAEFRGNHFGRFQIAKRVPMVITCRKNLA